MVGKCDDMIARCAGRCETGGILLGCIRGPHMEVLGFTISGPGDIEQPHSFVRQDRIHQQSAVQAWEASRETVTFVGEWHTHPAGPPSPSSIDITSWNSLARRTSHALVFIVVSPQGWSVNLVRRGTYRVRTRTLAKIEDGIEGQVFE